ncbi:hypothetical protein GCM10027428_27710 [Haliea atlantica]
MRPDLGVEFVPIHTEIAGGIPQPYQSGKQSQPQAGLIRSFAHGLDVIARPPTETAHETRAGQGVHPGVAVEPDK